MWRMFRFIVAVSLAVTPVALHAQRAQWQASSTTATSITGDLGLTDTKLSLSFTSFTIANIRDLSPQEVDSVFDWQKQDPNTGTGTLYSLYIPATQKFVRGNSLCGAQDVRWAAVYISAKKKKQLSLALFSGTKPPTFSNESIANSTDLCGTFVFQHY